MAKGKRRRSAGPGEDRNQKGREASQPPLTVNPPGEDRFTFAEYLVAVIFFWVFCGATFLVTYAWTGETIGMPFFFLALCAGFSVVAVFSWLHDLLYREEGGGEEPSA